MEINPSFWNGKRVLITGHTGFKGSWLCMWLNKLGAVVSGLSLNESVSNPNLFTALNINYLVMDNRGDISDYQTCFDTVKKTKPEIVIHMAAQPLVRLSYSNPLQTYNTNVLGTANLLEAIRECESVQSIIVITTDKCYENIEKDYAYVETDALGGYDPYSSSKACAEHVVSAYYRSFFKDNEVGLATARAGNVIGGGDWASDRLVPDMIRSWSKDNKVLIRHPEATRPWQHVLEPLCGYLTLAENLWVQPNEFSNAWNFGPDQHSVKTVQDTIEIAKKVWGDSAAYEHLGGGHLHEAHLLQLDSTKARTLLAWQPMLDFEKAVYTTINWYKNYYYEKQELLNYTLNQIIEYEELATHE